jgi:hypothetical protein
VSAEIIQFIRGPRDSCEQSDFPTIVFRSAIRPDDLVMDHADPAAIEIICPEPAGSGDA